MAGFCVSGGQEVAVVEKQAKAIRDVVGIELGMVGGNDFRIGQVTLILVISVWHRRLGSRANGG